MKKKQVQKQWVYQPPSPKFSASEKAKKMDQVKAIIDQLEKLSHKVSKIEIILRNKTKTSNRRNERRNSYSILYGCCPFCMATVSGWLF